MQITLYMTESEYITLSQLMRDTTPMMKLLREKKVNGFLTLGILPIVR